MRIIMTMILSLLASGALMAQDTTGTISGTVINIEEQPVKGAKVTVLRGDSINAVTTTDLKGRFITDKINAGMYEVRVVYKAHKRSIITKVPVREKKNSDMLVKIFEQSGSWDTSAVFYSYNIVAVEPGTEKKPAAIKRK